MGTVYDISESDLKRMDRYEGYSTVYDKTKVIVSTETNDAIEAITNFMND